MKHIRYMSMVVALLILALGGCNKEDESNRKVVVVKSVEGRSFYFMPIKEKGVTDVTVSIAWPSNWAYEKERNPLTPMVGNQLIFNNGTSRLSRPEVMALFNDKQADGHLMSSPGHVFGTLSFKQEHREEVVATVAELLQQPQYEQSWIDRVHAELVSKIKSSQTQSLNRMFVVARQAILGDSALNQFLSLPHLDSLAKPTVKDLQDWHHAVFTQSGVTVVVTGGLSEQSAGDIVDTLLSALPKVEHPPAKQAQANFAQKTILLHLPESEKSTLAFIGKLPPTSQGNDLADLLALSVLGQPAPGGPLFDAVSTELGARYGFEAGYANFDRNNRFMFIAGEVETSKLGQAKQNILETYALFRGQPDLVHFDDLKEQMVEGTQANFAFVDIIARSILELALDSRDTSGAPKTAEQLQSITQADVEARLSRAFPLATDLLIIAASPNADALADACVVTDAAEVATCE